MTDKRIEGKKKLILLADALIDDLFETSDDDILLELKEAGIDAATNSRNMRTIVEKARLKSRKVRLKTAKEGSRAAQAERVPSRAIDISEARRVLRKVLKQDGISLAARNEKEKSLSDDEVMEKYNDLVELNLITPDNSGGNLT